MACGVRDCWGQMSECGVCLVRSLIRVGTVDVNTHEALNWSMQHGHAAHSCNDPVARAEKSSLPRLRSLGQEGLNKGPFHTLPTIAPILTTVVFGLSNPPSGQHKRND